MLPGECRRSDSRLPSFGPTGAADHVHKYHEFFTGLNNDYDFSSVPGSHLGPRPG